MARTLIQFTQVAAACPGLCRARVRPRIHDGDQQSPHSGRPDPARGRRATGRCPAWVARPARRTTHVPSVAGQTCRSGQATSKRSERAAQRRPSACHHHQCSPLVVPQLTRSVSLPSPSEQLQQAHAHCFRMKTVAKLVIKS